MSLMSTGRSLTSEEMHSARKELAGIRKTHSRRNHDRTVQLPADIDANKVQLHRALLRTQETLEKLITENRILERKLQREAARRHAIDQPVAPSSERIERHYHHHKQQQQRHQPSDSTMVAPSSSLPYVMDLSSIIQQHQQQPQPTNVKTGVMDMMLMQNAQMHQLMMNQMMLAIVPKPLAQLAPPAAVTSSRDDVKTNAIDFIELLRAKKWKTPAVHHHHYSSAAANPQPSVVYLPPLQPKMPVAPLTRYKHRCRCCDDEILKPMRYWSPTPSNHEQRPAPVKPRKYDANHVSLRRFRRAAYVVLFTKIMQRRTGRKLFAQRNPVFTDEFMARIRMRECVGAIHWNFMHQPGKVLTVLKPLILDTSIDLTAAITNTGTREEQDAAAKSLASVVENITYFMTDIMPAGGVLGTHAKALLHNILQPGHVFPVGYFWIVEKELLKPDYRDRPTAADENDAHIVLIGLFLGRALIRTLLAKPEKYEVVSRVGHRARQNLRVLVTLFTHLLRRLYVPTKSTPLAMPAELSNSMYTDEEIKPVFKRLKTSFDYSEKILRDWSREYIKRMRSVPT